MNPAGNWTRFGCIATILLLFATFPAAGHAQAQGAIAGTVRDGATNQGLAGAQVLIAALSIGSLSGNDGSFEVEGVPVGTHTVEVQRIGYAIVRQEVAVTAGSETRLDVTMAEEAIILGGITAIGTRARPRTVTESAVPVDVIPASEIINQGDVDFTNILRNVVPSYNVNTQPISDAATFARPANLRGLSPDPDTGARERKEASPLCGDRMVRQQHLGRCPRARPLGHFRTGAGAGRGAA